LKSYSTLGSQIESVFNVFDNRTVMVERCIAQLLVGGTTLTATVMVLARVASSLTIGAP
jgi:hypothetical protein